MMNYKDKTGEEVFLDSLERDIKRLEDKVDTGIREIKAMINGSYVRKEEFHSLENRVNENRKVLVMVGGAVFLAVVTAILRLVLIS